MAGTDRTCKAMFSRRHNPIRISEKNQDSLHLSLPARIAGLVLPRLALLAQEVVHIALRWRNTTIDRAYKPTTGCHGRSLGLERTHLVVLGSCVGISRRVLRRFGIMGVGVGVIVQRWVNRGVRHGGPGFGASSSIRWSAWRCGAGDMLQCWRQITVVVVSSEAGML